MDGCAEKNYYRDFRPQAIGKRRGGWSTTKLRLIVARACHLVTWSLTPGHASDARRAQIYRGDVRTTGGRGSGTADG